MEEVGRKAREGEMGYVGNDRRYSRISYQKAFLYNFSRYFLDSVSTFCPCVEVLLSSFCSNFLMNFVLLVSLVKSIFLFLVLLSCLFCRLLTFYAFIVDIPV